MKQVEKHIISKTHDFYAEVDAASFLSKNLYSKANWYVRQVFIGTSKLKEEGVVKTAIWFRYRDLQKMMQRNNDVDYIALPRKISQQVLMKLDKNWKSFFAAMRAWKKNPEAFTGKPSLPKYKDKKKGRNMLTYTIQSISKKQLRKGIVALSGTKININTKQQNIRQARIIPILNGNYKIEIVYEKEIEKRNPPLTNIAGGDAGVNNLLAVTSNVKGIPFLLINGRPLKSINQYYNKERARLLSCLMLENKNRRTSKALEKLTHKRNCKVDDYLHKASKLIVDYLVEHNIGVLVLGKNPLWKQDANMGKKNNQSFVNIPHARFINIITYKCELRSIKVVEQEEAHTSKTSFLDAEPVQHHEKYMGTRVSRGMFRSMDGTRINADCNGSGQITRKAIPTAFDGYGIEGFLVNPVRVTPKGYYSKKQKAAVL